MKKTYIDVHCHLDFCEKIEELINNAKSEGVEIIVAQGVGPNSNRKVLEYSKKFQSVKAALGLYPIDALKLSDKEVEDEIKFIRDSKEDILAIGEVGLDFKEDEKEHERQTRIFTKIVNLSNDIGKPLIIHSRKAEKETIELLKKLEAKKVIMHCFSGKKSLINEIIIRGWNLTVPTNVKFSEHFQLICKICPIEQLFCETDSPYLHPNKGWPNEPSNVVESYKEIAKIKNITVDEVKEKIYDNYVKLFE
jgi:TatD DNase family protein